MLMEDIPGFKKQKIMIKDPFAASYPKPKLSSQQVSKTLDSDEDDSDDEDESLGRFSTSLILKLKE